ncbi:HU family DNA-binding protein [bacterium]|nr:HU family DNA-binding protein [bacterium]
MTTTKENIAYNLMAKTTLNRKDAKKLIEKLLQLIKKTLGSGTGIIISGFGEFRVKQKSERIGRNPKTKIEYTITERTVVTFCSSKVLRNELNADTQ